MRSSTRDKRANFLHKIWLIEMISLLQIRLTAAEASQKLQGAGRNSNEASEIILGTVRKEIEDICVIGFQYKWLQKSLENLVCLI